MSNVRCHVSSVTCFFFFLCFFSFYLFDKVVKLVGGGSIINMACPVYFFILFYFIFFFIFCDLMLQCLRNRIYFCTDALISKNLNPIFHHKAFKLKRYNNATLHLTVKPPNSEVLLELKRKQIKIGLQKSFE